MMVGSRGGGVGMVRLPAEFFMDTASEGRNDEKVVCDEVTETYMCLCDRNCDI